MAKLEGRFVWLLETMCRKQGIDVQLIDSELTYAENKTNIERQVHKRLRLGEDWQGKKAGRVVENFDDNFDEEEIMVGDEWYDEFQREMRKQQERREAVDKVLNRNIEKGVEFGGKERKAKVERWNGGVRFVEAEDDGEEI